VLETAELARDDGSPVGEETCPAIEIAGVAKAFNGSGGTEVAALRGIDLTVGPGEFVAIVGSSGCGKSTLLRLVAGFEAASEGRVAALGRLVEGPAPDRGIVFQDYGLFPWATVAENVAWGPRHRGLDREEVRERTKRFVDLVGLAEFADRFPQELSGGMQQRVALARVLANDPPILLMDEPFGALDSLTRQQMQQELHRLWLDLRPAVLFVTHSVEEAIFLADRVVVLSGGPAHGVPGHVRASVDVELDHPRDITAEPFNAIKRRLMDEIFGGPAHAAIEQRGG
jgi:ABC-type nitrate/sulfonate/bicarbonate transport system ATPase subunit